MHYTKLQWINLFLIDYISMSSHVIKKINIYIRNYDTT